MKIMKRIIYPVIVLVAFLSLSCEDYLKEEVVAQATYEYYNSEKGMEDLVNAAYSGLRYKFNGEQSFTLFNYGVDEYKQAADGQNKYFDSYTSQLNPVSAAYIHDMWSEYYSMINTCNIGIERIPQLTEGVNFISSEEGKAQRIAELRFLRGFYYFILVQQFGSIPVSLQGNLATKVEFDRQPVADIYEVIISDLRHAEAILPPAQSEPGRITKGAARHYLAKVYLTRGSAVNDERGQKPADMDSAAYFAEQVIAMTDQYELMEDFAYLWDIENEDNKEIILSAQFNNNPLLLSGSGNRVHLYFNMVYDVKPGMLRDIANGRPWRRLQPTDYAMDVFDRRNDSRFYKSFKTTWFSNNPGTIPTWTQADANAGYVDASLVGEPKFEQGDTAIFLSMRTNVPEAEIKSKPYLFIPRDHFTLQDFLTLVKHLDPTRLDVGTETASRDGVYARLAETYLIAAEAYGRNGDYGTAAGYINDLRTRAAYKDGEAKPSHHWLTEGGGYLNTENTIAELLIDETYWDNDVAIEQYPPSATDKASRFIHFMLNERTRELIGELHRWEDLVRTETFQERVNLYNPNARGNVQAFHKLRPIPQQHIDRLFKDGVPLTDEQKAQQQNTGYQQ